MLLYSNKCLFCVEETISVSNLINILNAWRANKARKDFYEGSLKAAYFFRNILAYARGLFVCLCGKVRQEGAYRPLLIGSSTQLLIRPESSIVLKNDNDDTKNIYHNNPIYLTATTIGMRPHYLALDPPANNTTRIELLGNAQLVLHRNTMILTGSYISASNGAIISIGNNTYISPEVIINSRNAINIGKNVLIGYQVMMMDYDAHTVIHNIHADNRDLSNKSNPINIGDNVWIGARVSILKGITIGSGSIIGANSCVVTDIPENSLAVGNPAKVVRKNTSWQR